MRLPWKRVACLNYDEYGLLNTPIGSIGTDRTYVRWLHPGYIAHRLGARIPAFEDQPTEFSELRYGEFLVGHEAMHTWAHTWARGWSRPFDTALELLLAAFEGRAPVSA